jgi:adenylate cyclase
MSEPTSSNPGEQPLFEVDHQMGETDELSGVRHSLRTPLNQIIGYCEMLQEDLSDLGQEHLLPDLQKIHTAGGQLVALINEGLAPWKIETGRVDLDSMRLEMRTPLNLIIGYAELSQEMMEDSGNQRITSDLQKITAAAHNLLTMFNSQSFPAQINTTTRNSLPGGSAEATLGRGTTFIRKVDVGGSGNGRILLIDDNEMNRNMLGRRLERLGHKVTEAENGLEGLSMLQTGEYDLILLDVLMPVMNGFETLKQLKADMRLRHLPVIMISAMDEIDAAVNCIEAGAEDYLPKPFNPVLLKARISASLEKKRLRDSEQAHTAELRIEREKSDRLLHCILPKAIAERLKNGETTIADTFDESTVLFADIVDFEQQAKLYPPERMVQLLNDIFSGFDWLVDMHAMERIRTVGDSYMAVAGVPSPRADHSTAAVEVAMEMLRITNRFNSRNGVDFKVRVGVCTGPVMAGIVGRKKFLYYLWGQTVNIARELENTAPAGAIQVNQTIHDLLQEKYVFKAGDKPLIVGKDKVATYFVTGRPVKTA